jgi:hypothetical protein
MTGSGTSAARSEGPGTVTRPATELLLTAAGGRSDAGGWCRFRDGTGSDSSERDVEFAPFVSCGWTRLQTPSHSNAATLSRFSSTSMSVPS